MASVSDIQATSLGRPRRCKRLFSVDRTRGLDGSSDRVRQVSCRRYMNCVYRSRRRRCPILSVYKTDSSSPRIRMFLRSIQTTPSFKSIPSFNLSLSLGNATGRFLSFIPLPFSTPYRFYSSPTLFEYQDEVHFRRSPRSRPRRQRSQPA
jgi:hypothetical protein